jgi:hypothetical protein
MELHSLLRVVQNHLNPLDGMDCPRDASKVCGNAKRVESHEAGSAGFDQRKNKEIQGCQILQAKDLHAIGDPKGSCLTMISVSQQQRLRQLNILTCLHNMVSII